MAAVPRRPHRRPDLQRANARRLRRGRLLGLRGLLRRAVLDPGSSRAISSLVRTEEQCEIYLIDLPPDWLGRGFGEMLPIAKQTLDVLLVAVEPAGADLVINPPGDHAFATGDRLAVIAQQRPDV